MSTPNRLSCLFRFWLYSSFAGYLGGNQSVSAFRLGGSSLSSWRPIFSGCDCSGTLRHSGAMVPPTANPSLVRIVSWRHRMCQSNFEPDRSAAMALNTDVFKERHIILLCNNVSEDVGKGVFRPNNLLEGRIDVICRCIANALFFSNGVRR